MVASYCGNYACILHMRCLLLHGMSCMSVCLYAYTGFKPVHVHARVCMHITGFETCAYLRQGAQFLFC
jgi:hypothetical protein